MIPPASQLPPRPTFALTPIPALLPSAHLDSGNKALSQGDARAAIGFLLEYMRQDPSNLSAYLNLERAYWQAGERLEALNTFRRILELSPGHDEALQFLRGLGR